MALRVNGQVITEQAIAFELARLVKFYSEHMARSEVQAQMEALRQKAKEQAVGAKLLLDEARRLDIRVPAADIEAKLQEFAENAGGPERLQELLTKQHLTRDTVRKSVEQGRKVDLLIDKVTAGLDDPTEDELQAHYQTHRAEYVKPERARAQHILVKPHSGGQEDRATARSKLLEIRRRIKDGADFADMAAAHSECPSGKKAGGSLGWISKGTLVPEFDSVLFAMGDGELSDVVETTLGFHLISKTSSAPAAPADYDDVKEQVRDFLRHVRRGEAVAAFVREIKAKAVIEED